MKFSIVVPVHARAARAGEIDLIPITLPSYYAVNPSEVIVCTDKPTPKKVCQVIQKVAVACDAQDITRIVQVERNPEWHFHQAYVRRTGFHKAKHDRILTTDIDLIINKKVHKALELVGKNDVGLVSISKFTYPKHLSDYWRIAALMFLRTIVHGMVDSLMATTTFAGLYALWRPYWLDSEPEQAVKKLINPKQIYRGEKSSIKLTSPVTGEDTFLRDCMIKKHRCIYLKDIGAINLGIDVENRPFIQYMIGKYFARQGRPFYISLGRAILRGQPYYLKGHLAKRAQKEVEKNGKI